MSKRLKTALLICMLFCLTLFGAVFAACSPTEDDPDPENPWDEQYRTGTAIRSDEAWKQYDQEQAASIFASTINPTDLQGWSHDYTTEGTRG